MKSYVMLLALALPFAAVAEDETPVNAPQEVIAEAVQSCKSYAQEDEVSDTELMDYLLLCVNDELEMAGFNLITLSDLAKIVG